MVNKASVIMALTLLMSQFLYAGNDKNDDKKKSKKEEKIEICHNPPGNRDHSESIRVDASALATHLQHGDYQGACVAKTCNLSIVSDAATLVEGSGPAVASYQHPVWIDPALTAAFNSAIWIWSSYYVQNPRTDETNTFTRTIPWTGGITSAVLNLASDNSNEITVNGTVVANNPQEDNFRPGRSGTYDLKAYLHNGYNTLKIKVKNFAMAGSSPTSNPAGLLYRLDIAASSKDCNLRHKNEFHQEEQDD